MKPDNKPSRRVIYKTNEVRIYDASQRNKGAIEERLNEIGYRSKEEYTDTVSHLAW